MAAAAITPTIVEAVPNLGAKLEEVQANIVTTGDWLIFPKAVGFSYFTLPTGAITTQAYAVAAVNTDADAATATTLTYDGATAAQLPTSGTEFYIMCGTEIMKVTSYTSTVFTVIRGCMGTTAAVHAENAVIYILNTLVIAAGTVGLVRGLVSYME